jgi:hypothetical protein
LWYFDAVLGMPVWLWFSDVDAVLDMPAMQLSKWDFL